MKLHSAIVSLSWAAASFQTAFSFTPSSVLNNIHQRQQSSVSSLDKIPTTALSVASADISEEVRRRKTREVCSIDETTTTKLVF
jgi:hypothetical protein